MWLPKIVSDYSNNLKHKSFCFDSSVETEERQMIFSSAFSFVLFGSVWLASAPEVSKRDSILYGTII